MLRAARAGRTPQGVFPKLRDGRSSLRLSPWHRLGSVGQCVPRATRCTERCAKRRVVFEPCLSLCCADSGLDVDCEEDSAVCRIWGMLESDTGRVAVWGV